MTLVPVQSHELFEGALVVHVYAPQGAWGWEVEIPAKVVRLGLDGTRAVISFSSKDGAILCARNVPHSELRWKKE
jgi:hypothetical protein